MLQEIFFSFLQFLRYSSCSPARFPKEGGSSVIAVSSRESSFKPLTFTRISGNLDSFTHPLRIRLWRDSDSRLLGKSWRLQQFIKFKWATLRRRPSDWWTSTKLLHSPRSKCSRFCIKDKSGIRSNKSQPLKLMNLRFWRRCKTIGRSLSNWIFSFPQWCSNRRYHGQFRLCNSFSWKTEFSFSESTSFRF